MEDLSFKSRFSDDNDLTTAFKKKLASMERKVRDEKESLNLFSIADRAKSDHGVFIWVRNGKYPRSDALEIFPATGDQKAEKKAAKAADKRYNNGENATPRQIL